MNSLRVIILSALVGSVFLSFSEGVPKLKKYKLTKFYRPSLGTVEVVVPAENSNLAPYYKYLKLAPTVTVHPDLKQEPDFAKNVTLLRIYNDINLESIVYQKLAPGVDAKESDEKIYIYSFAKASSDAHSSQLVPPQLEGALNVANTLASLFTAKKCYYLSRDNDFPKYSVFDTSIPSEKENCNVFRLDSENKLYVPKKAHAFTYKLLSDDQHMLIRSIAGDVYLRFYLIKGNSVNTFLALKTTLTDNEVPTAISEQNVITCLQLDQPGSRKCKGSRKVSVKVFSGVTNGIVKAFYFSRKVFSPAKSDFTYFSFYKNAVSTKRPFLVYIDGKYWVDDSYTVHISKELFSASLGNANSTHQNIESVIADNPKNIAKAVNIGIINDPYWFVTVINDPNLNMINNFNSQANFEINAFIQVRCRNGEVVDFKGKRLPKKQVTALNAFISVTSKSSVELTAAIRQAEINGLLHQRSGAKKMMIFCYTHQAPGSSKSEDRAFVVNTIVSDKTTNLISDEFSRDDNTLAGYTTDQVIQFNNEIRQIRTDVTLSLGSVAGANHVLMRSSAKFPKIVRLSAQQQT